MVANHTQVHRGRVLGLGIARAFVLVGLDAQPVRVEVSTTRGPSFFQWWGWPRPPYVSHVCGLLASLGVLLDEHAVTVASPWATSEGPEPRWTCVQFCRGRSGAWHAGVRAMRDAMICYLNRFPVHLPARLLGNSNACACTASSSESVKLSPLRD
jgi:hypothetical protein